MNNTKAFKIMTVISIILATIISCLCFKNERTKQELLYTQNNAKLTLEQYNNLQSDLDNALINLRNDLNNANNNLKIESGKVAQMLEQLNHMSGELNVANNTITALKSQEYELLYIGEFKLTHYCNEFYEHVCGYGDGLTATGTNVTPGRTIAVDPKVIPYGTEVYIEGYGWRVAEDCGGSVKGNHIDIAVNTHSEAMDMGIEHGGVWILVKKGY